MGGFLSRRRKASKVERKAASIQATTECGGTGETLAPAAGEPAEGKDSVPETGQPTASKMSDEKSLSNESANQGTSEDSKSQTKETLKQKLRLSRGRVRPRSAQTKPAEATSKQDLATQCSFFTVTNQAGQQEAPKTESTAIDGAEPSYSEISFIDKSDDQDKKEGGDGKVTSTPRKRQTSGSAKQTAGADKTARAKAASPSQPIPDQSNSELKVSEPPRKKKTDKKKPAVGVNNDDMKLESMEDDLEENTASQKAVTAAVGDGGGRQSSTPTKTQERGGDAGGKKSPKAGPAPTSPSGGAHASEYLKAAKPPNGKNKKMQNNRRQEKAPNDGTADGEEIVKAWNVDDRIHSPYSNGKEHGRDNLSYQGGSTTPGSKQLRNDEQMTTGNNSEQEEGDQNQDGSGNTNGDDRFYSPLNSRADDKDQSDEEEEDESIEQWMYYGERKKTQYETSARGYEYPTPRHAVSPRKPKAQQPVSSGSAFTNTEQLPNRSATRLIYVRSHHLVETDSEEENAKECQGDGSPNSLVQVGGKIRLLEISSSEAVIAPIITYKANAQRKAKKKGFLPDAMDSPTPGVTSSSNTPLKEKKKGFSPDAMDSPTPSVTSSINTPRKEKKKKKGVSPDAMDSPTPSVSSSTNTPQKEKKKGVSPDAMDSPTPSVTSNTPRKEKKKGVSPDAMDSPTPSVTSNTPRKEKKKGVSPDAMDSPTPSVTSNTPRKEKKKGVSPDAMDSPTPSVTSNTPRKEKKKGVSPDAMDSPTQSVTSNTPRKEKKKGVSPDAMDSPTPSVTSNTPRKEKKKGVSPDAMASPTPSVTSNTPRKEKKKGVSPDAMASPTPSVTSNTPRKEKKKGVSPDAMASPTPSVTSNTPRKEKKKGVSPDAMASPTPSVTSNTPRKEKKKGVSPDAMASPTPSVTSNTPRKEKKKGVSPDAMASPTPSVTSNTPRKEKKKGVSPDAMDSPTPSVTSNTPRKEKKKGVSPDTMDSPTPGVTSSSITPRKGKKKGFSPDAMDAQEPKAQVQTENADDLLAGNGEEMSEPQETKDTANILNSSAVTEPVKYPNQAKSGDTTMSMGNDETTKGVVEMQEGETVTLLLLRGNLPCEGREDVKKGAGDGANMSDEKVEADERASIGMTTMLDDRSKSSCQLEDLQAENSGIENTHSIEPFNEQMSQTEQATENDSSVACAAADDEPQAQRPDEEEDEGLAGKAVQGQHIPGHQVPNGRTTANSFENENTDDAQLPTMRATSPQDGAAMFEEKWKMVPAHRVTTQTNLGAPPGNLPPLRPRTSYIRTSRPLRGAANPLLIQVKSAALMETTAQSLSDECPIQDEINKMFDARSPGHEYVHIARDEENGEIPQGKYGEMRPSVNESNEMEVTEIPEGSLGLQGNSVNTAPDEEQPNSDPLAEAADPKDEPDAPERDDNSSQE